MPRTNAPLTARFTGAKVAYSIIEYGMPDHKTASRPTKRDPGCRGAQAG